MHGVWTGRQAGMSSCIRELETRAWRRWPTCTRPPLPTHVWGHVFDTAAFPKWAVSFQSGTHSALRIQDAPSPGGREHLALCALHFLHFPQDSGAFVLQIAGTVGRCETVGNILSGKGNTQMAATHAPPQASTPIRRAMPTFCGRSLRRLLRVDDCSGLLRQIFNQLQT